MPGFAKLAFDYSFDVDRESAALTAHALTRGIPARSSERLLLATWNIANLGATEQLRDPECLRLIADVIGRFDLVAAQEVRDNVDAAREVLSYLPDSWRLLFSEAGRCYSEDCWRSRGISATHATLQGPSLDWLGR